MTLQELSQLYYLNREIKMDKRRLAELELKVLPGAQSMSGMPHAPGVADKVGTYAAEMADLRAIIEEKSRRCLEERIRLERYIAGIEDSLMRQIFTYRFVDGRTWGQVAQRVGGQNTAASVKMLCHRYLERE